MKKLNILLAKLEKLHPKYIDLSLVRIKRLLAKIGNPHLKLPVCLHFAGTNGKGSTLNFTKQIMVESGYIVHAYTSPHLERINERFFLSNKIISNKILIKTLKFIEKVNNNHPITFYEITTAATFYLFNKYPADFVLLETGLGGRLDATNIIIDPVLSIITPISIDHQEYLGKTIDKIVIEKLGIVKKSSTILCSKQSPKVKKQINDFARKNNNKIISYGKNWVIKNYKNNFLYYKTNKDIIKFNKPSLLGEHQIFNASTALTAILYLKKIGYKFNKNNINQGLKNTIWTGRLERINKIDLQIYLDGAHNEAGALSLMKFIKNSKKETWIILGMLANKNVYTFLSRLKRYINGIIAINIPNEKNSMKLDEIERNCNKLKIFCKKEKNILAALKYLEKNHKPKQIIVTGSLYLIGKIRKKLINY